VDAKRYTATQVFCGLREAWCVATGTDESFDFETQIYSFMMADGSWEELDLGDVCHRLEGFFGFSCSQEEWWSFFEFEVAYRSREEWEQKVAPNLTFGKLAQFIADRAPAVASFQPAPVMGRNCAAAGVFLGIEQVAAKVKNNLRPFPPSARIIDVMRGNDLDNFWMQLRWMTEDSIPKLPAFWRNITFFAGSVSFLAVIGGFIAAYTLSHLSWVIWAVAAAGAVYSSAFDYKWIKNPIPSQIVSFRDLSILIAKARKSAA
jgi:hypothetical protein